MRRPSGERRALAWYLTPLLDEAGRSAGILGSGVDVTERRQLEEQLREAQKLEAIGRLAGGVAHDFNNILSTIKGYAAMLRREIPADSPLRPDFDEIVAGADRAASLTRSLLTFSRRQPSVPEPVDLVIVVQRCERLLRRLVREDVELTTALPDGPVVVMADPLQVEQVLMNLVTNARDAMPEGGRVSITLERIALDAEDARRAGVAAAGAYARLTVSDTGVGIDAATQRRIFEPFFTTKAPEHGTGLGLAIVYGLVTQHHGSIRVVSAPGAGASFLVLLPIVDVELPPAPSADPSAAPGGTETVLVAEDDGAVRKMLRLILQGAGYGVIEAADGEEAVRRFEEHRSRIQMVVLDVIMPRQNGRAALDRIRTLAPDVPAMFLSGHAEDPAGNLAIELGGERLVSKPVHPRDLLRAVRQALDARPRTAPGG